MAISKYTRRRRVYKLWIGANSVSDGLFLTNENIYRGDKERLKNENQRAKEDAEILYLKRFTQNTDEALNKAIRKSVSTKAQHLDKVEANDGLRIEFDVSRSIYGGSGKMTLKIFNLSKKHRSMIFQDYFAPKNTPPLIRSIVLSAGYEGEPLGLVFTGQTMFCCSYKQGQDFITEIQALDGGMLAMNYDFGHLKLCTDKDMTRQELFEDFILSKLKDSGIDVGKVSLGKSKDDVLKAGVSIDGNVLSAAKKYCGKDDDGNERNVFIDMNKFYVMSEQEALATPVLSKFDSSMILGTPKTAYATLTFNCVFEPRLKIGQLLEVAVEGTGITLNEELGGIYSGVYKVIGIKHTGGISDSTPSNLITTVEVATRNSFLQSVTKKENGE